MTNSLPITIVGINEAGHESGNQTFCDGRELPWLQELETGDIWTDWGVTYRDVIIVDGEGRVVAIYNLTDHDLSSPSDYDALKDMLVNTANPTN